MKVLKCIGCNTVAVLLAGIICTFFANTADTLYIIWYVTGAFTLLVWTTWATVLLIAHMRKVSGLD